MAHSDHYTNNPELKKEVENRRYKIENEGDLGKL